MQNPSWTIRTFRLTLAPVRPEDFADILALKSDPRCYAIMRGGVRDLARAWREMEQDLARWGASGYGTWTVRLPDRRLAGLVSLEPRAEGVALRFAFDPACRGAGLAREAAGCALRYGHATARLPRIVAVARETNFSSRAVLGAIGMRPVSAFPQGGLRMILFESCVTPG